jgi:hypothetical protein
MQRDDQLRTLTRSSLTTFKKTSECLPADGISAALWKERELGMSCRQLYFLAYTTSHMRGRGHGPLIAPNREDPITSACSQNPAL